MITEDWKRNRADIEKWVLQKAGDVIRKVMKMVCVENNFQS